MWKRNVAAIFFLVWASFFVFRAQPAWSDAGVAMALGVVVVGWLEYFARQRRRRDEFLNWLGLHAQEVLAGGATYMDMRITRETEYFTYWGAFSFGIYSMLVPSGLHIGPLPRHSSHRIALLLSSLTFGLWGIPWGPIYTFRAIRRNVSPAPSLISGLLVAQT